MRNIINLSDKMAHQDFIEFDQSPRSGIYAKTRIIGGYDLQEFNGVTSLGETLFDNGNMIPIGGTQRCFESIWGVKGTLEVPTVYDLSGGSIGLPNKTILDYERDGETSRFYVPAMSGDTNYLYQLYPIGDVLSLFGVGITGSATNVLTKPDVNYLENSINYSMAIENDREMTGIMLPFRYNATRMSDADAIKYFGKTGKWTATTSDPIGYYLKRFERDAVIKHFWKSGSDETEATNPVSQNEYYPRTNTTNSAPIESYVEMVLKINTKDMKEWFKATDSIDATRVNTVALYTGRYNSLLGDYENVRLFSKLTFPVVSLSASRDFTIIYRVFAS